MTAESVGVAVRVQNPCDRLLKGVFQGDGLGPTVKACCRKIAVSKVVFEVLVFAEEHLEGLNKVPVRFWSERREGTWIRRTGGESPYPPSALKGDPHRYDEELSSPVVQVLL